MGRKSEGSLDTTSLLDETGAGGYRLTGTRVSTPGALYKEGRKVEKIMILNIYIYFEVYIYGVHPIPICRDEKKKHREIPTNFG